MTQNNLMPTIGATAITALIAYLLGSISFAIIVSKVYAHDDIRKYGSKNAGMTNILRTYGKLPAFFTLLGDFLKGVLAVVIGRWIFSTMGITAFDAGYVAGFFALLGHLYPVYFGFKGGKGVASTFGFILATNPQIALLALATWLVCAVITRYSSLSAITAAIATPVYAFFLVEPTYTIFYTAIALLVLLRHRANIVRLAKGEESKISFKKK